MALDKEEKSLTISLTFSLTITLPQIIKALTSSEPGILTFEIYYQLVNDSYHLN